MSKINDHSNSARSQRQQGHKSWRDVLPIHPAADLFPEMSADELQALGEDIQQHGLHEGIALLDGKLLDGRNRLDAMERVGINLVIGGKLDWANIAHRNVKPRNPVAYVISKNIHRRHLNAEDRPPTISYAGGLQ
jgi:hypothetical protein